MSDETELKRRVHQQLAPHFAVHPEVHLREPMRGLYCRVDFAIVPPPALLEAGFPFEAVVIEVKRAGVNARVRRHAFGQCLSYRHCVFADRRLVELRGLFVPAAALYTADRSRFGETKRTLDDSAFYGEVRLAGTQNVGVLVHHAHDGLQLEIAAARIWNERRGVTGNGANWPSARRFANSTRRVQ